MKNLRTSFATSLRHIRTAKGLTQEDFSEISSRTYLSSLERGQKCPTIEKVDQIARQMGIHPLSLMLFTYMDLEGTADLEKMCAKITGEINVLLD